MHMSNDVAITGKTNPAFIFNEESDKETISYIA